MKNKIIGTAGHIDHGKTTLIKALTGIETDRLAEEKKRGITIDLGFAYLIAPDGDYIGIIDVPGHEKFIKNMLAGAGGVDMVLLVIAADEGIMPQTEEHLSILSLLNAQRGIIAVTKADLVEAEWLEMVIEEISERVRGTFLQDAAIMPVSATSGQGIDSLKQAIFSLLQDVEDKDDQAPLRIPIDRVFTIDGFGTVITGTQIEGTLKVGDALTLYPQGRQVKVKGIQVHGKAVQTSHAGQRVAVNLAGLKKEEVKRGETLAQTQSLFVTEVLDIQLQLLENISRPLSHRARVRFYNGTDEVLARVVLLDVEQLEGNQSAYVQLRLEQPVALKVDDPFVLRYYSPLETIGGGVVLDVNPVKHKRFNDDVISDLELLASGSQIDRLERAIQRFGSRFQPIAYIALQLGREVAALQEDLNILESDGLIIKLSEQYYIHKQYLQQLNVKASQILQNYHEENPLKGGIDRQEFRSRLFNGVSNKEIDRLIELLARENVLRVSQQSVALADFQVVLDRRQTEMIEQILQAVKDAEFTPPTVRELVEKFADNNQSERLINHLIRRGQLVKVDQKLVYHPDVISRTQALIKTYLAQRETLSLADFRDQIQASRKYAIALLEYFDREKFTKKIDDYRVLY